MDDKTEFRCERHRRIKRLSLCPWFHRRASYRAADDEACEFRILERFSSNSGAGSPICRMIWIEQVPREPSIVSGSFPAWVPTRDRTELADLVRRSSVLAR